LYKQEKYKEAAEEFDKATKLTDDKEKLSSIYHNLGNSLYKAEDYGKSVDAYKNALKNNPKDDETRFNLALAQKKLQMQQQQQQQQNDQNKEQNKDKKQQEQNQDKQEEKQEEQKQQEQQQQQNSEEMSQETAEQILEAFSQDEKQLQEEMQRRKGGQRSLEKDW
jgi:tetratricopeptide (TPR) repeat protein